MKNKTNHSIFLIPGIILLGAVMRVPITGIPPILNEIAQGLHIQVSSLGLLTTLTLIAFAIFSPIAPIIARKLGNEVTFALVLALLLIGSLIRIISTPMLFFGTILIGISIAHINVLLPSLIVANFPKKTGLYTSVYTFMAVLMTAIFSAIAVPIVNTTNWQTLIFILSMIVAIALVIWLPNIKYNQVIKVIDMPKTKISPWKNLTAWYMLIFMGLQSAVFYTSVSWLPTIAAQSGLNNSLAGILAGVNALISLPVSFLVPNVIARLNTKKRKIFVIITSLFAAISFAMILFANASFSFWLILNILNGLATGSLFPYILISFSNKTNNHIETAELSGMAQSGGYLIAALGPVLYGSAFSIFNSWTVQTIFMIIAIVIMAVCALLIEQKEKIFN